MPTGAQLRQAVLDLVDQLNSYTKRTFTATGGTTTTITSTDLAALPDDATLFKGGYVRLANAASRFVTNFDVSADGETATVTFRPSSTAPSNGDTIEFSRNWTSEQIDQAIATIYHSSKHRFWTPTTQVLTVRQQFVHEYKLPLAWTGVGSVQYAGTVVNSGNNLASFAALSSNRTATWTPSRDTWVRYVAVYIKGPATTDMTVQLGSLGTATLEGDDTSPTGQWMVGDLGFVALATGGVSYTITVSGLTSGASAGVDSSGNAVWQIYQDQGDWLDLPQPLWELVPERTLRLRDTQMSRSIYNGDPGAYVNVDALIRVSGIRYPAQPANGNVLEVPWDYMLYNTAFILMPGRFQQQSVDQEDARARVWAAQLAVADQAVTPWPGNVRRIPTTVR